MDGSGAFPSGPQLSLEQFRGLFPLFGILFEVGFCGLLHEWPLPETRQGHQPVLGAQLRGLRPSLGIRQVPRAAVERGHTWLLGFWRGYVWGPWGWESPTPGAAGVWGESRSKETALAAWGLRPAGPLPHPGVRINSIPPASTEHPLEPEKLYLLTSRLVRRGRQPSNSLTNRPTDRGASRSSEGAGVSSDAPRAVSLHREGNRASNARRKVSCEAGGGGCCSQPPPRGFGLLFSSGFSNGPFVSPRRPASGTSSVGQAPAVPSACGCVVCGCAPRWGGQDRSVTPAATRYCTRPLRPGRDCKRCSY